MSTTTSAARRWVVPVTGVALGVLMFLAAASQDQPRLGLWFLAIMVIYSAVLVIFRDREPIALLSDDWSDERRVHLHQRAAYLTLNIVALVVIGGFLWSLATRGDGRPWALIGFVGGATYIGTLVVLSRRG